MICTFLYHSPFWHLYVSNHMLLTFYMFLHLYSVDLFLCVYLLFTCLHSFAVCVFVFTFVTLLFICLHCFYLLYLSTVYRFVHLFTIAFYNPFFTCLPFLPFYIFTSYTSIIFTCFTVVYLLFCSQTVLLILQFCLPLLTFLLV